MGVKRAKQYRKLMHQYALHFGFREPYQVLLDSDILRAAADFKMDLIKFLELRLQGQVKPMITQCSMRHLYSAEPKDEALIERAKTYERRRCNHHTLEKPLSTLECLSEVVDSKEKNTNKHRYIVASQDDKVRARMRRIPGVPLLYITRSDLILEPMSRGTEGQIAHEEREKLRAGIKSKRGQLGEKRKHDDNGENELGGEAGAVETEDQAVLSTDQPEKKKRKRGPKGPNPLSVKKAKKSVDTAAVKVRKNADNDRPPDMANHAGPVGESTGEPKGRRKRKHKAKVNDTITDSHTENAATIENGT